MKTKIKRHYRSVVSVLLSVCMLVSCIAVGLIGTDAAKVTDSDNVAAASTDEAVGASVDADARVGSGAGYILKSDNDNPSGATDTGATVTKSGSKYTATLPISLFRANRNYYIMLSSSTSYTNSFYQGQNITVTKTSASTQISGYGSQSRDNYRMARFSLSTTEGISGIKVEVSSKTYTLSTVSSATTTYSVTVNAGANGSVVAGSTAIAANNSATVSVTAGSTVSLVATPVQGYSFKEWTVSGNCSVASATSASTTLSATANGGTVTATYTKNATATRRIYYDNSSTHWTTPYAYAVLSDGTPCLGTAPGTAMSHDSTDDVWYIDVNAEVAKIRFSGNSTGTGASELRTDIPDYLNPEFYDYDGSGSGGSWKKHEEKTLPNEVNAVLSNDVKNNANLFTNIKASFFDYLTDDEIGSGKSWYTSIKPLEDGWIADDYNNVTNSNYWDKIKRNPYKALNKALSAYANQQSVKYPMYFGAFYTSPSYKNPGYYRSATKVLGHIINDSNQLGNSSDSNRYYRSLPGLAGTSIADGSIHYADSFGENGAPMVLFDKEWLNSRTTGSNSDTAHRIYFDPGDQWSQAGDYRVVQHGSDWWDGKKVTYDSSLGIYYFDLEEHTDKIRFVRTNSSLGDSTFKVRGSDGKLIWSSDSQELPSDWAYNYTDVITLSDNNMYLMTNWTTYETKKFYGHYSNYQYDGKLGQVVNSQFPVVKRTTNNGKVTYYEFNSNNATDNIWFDNLTTSTNPTLNYGSGSTKGVKAGYVDSQTYGFFPFDKYDRNNGHGKDLGFGMKLEIEFTLGPNGQVQGTDGNWYDQIFYFSGDDDLWVYVDDTLLLDLGGDHKMSEATVNFHSRSIRTTRTPNTSITAEQGTARNQNFTWLENNDTSKIHKMTIYYMERGMQESNLKFGFSFYPVDNKFVATEEMSYDGVNSALASDVATLAANDSIVVTHYADTNETPSTLAANKTYRLNAATDGKSTGSTGTYTLKNGDKATFLKQFDDGEAGNVASITNKPQNFMLTAADGASNVFSYSTVLKSVTDMQEERAVTVTGTDKNIFTFRTLKDPKYDTDPTDIQADLLSTIKTKNLMITKDLVGAEDTEHPFTLKIEIDLDGAGSKKGYQVYELPYLLNGTSGTLPDTGLIDVKKDDVIIITGIPVNAKVRVSENTASINSVYEYKTTEVFPQSGDGTTAYNAYSEGNFKGAEFTVLTDDFVTVINKIIPTYSLNVKKLLEQDNRTPFDLYVYKVSGNASPYDLIAYSGSYELINADSTSGSGSTSNGKISLTKNQQFVISGIREGDVYLVYEDISGLPSTLHYVSTAVTGANASTLNPTVNTTEYKGALVTFGAADIHVNVTNEEEAKYRYHIVYNYEGYTKITYNDYVDKNPDNRKTGPARSYTVDEEISKTELGTYFDIDATTKALSFKTEPLKKEFVSNKAPYEDDFMLELRWDGAVTDSYMAETKTISMETTAATTDKSEVHASFMLPYAVTDDTTLAAADGAAKITPKTHTLDTYYGNWVTTNGEYKNEKSAAFVTAPMTLTDNGKTLYFQYWQITSDANTSSAKRDLSVDNKRCYYHQFNMTMYQDNVIVPVYEETPSDLTPRERSYEYNKGGVAKIDFIENSRNQWNADGAPDESNVARRTAGDRIYSDFLLTFDYKDIKLQTNPNSNNIKAGFAFERVAKLDVDLTDPTKYVTKKQSEYHTANESTEASGKTAVENCAMTGNREGDVLFIENIDLTDLDNKNQMKYSFNITNKAYGTLAESENKNYVYRAYSYLKITNGSTTTVVVSDPVYFTIYDMATINPGQTI